MVSARTFPRLLGVLLCLAWSGSQVLAQSSARIVDAGSFSIVRNGERVGREQFSIRQVPGPDGTIAEWRAESAVGNRRSAYRLEVDSTGAPVRYAVEVRTGTDLTTRLGGQRIRTRFTTLLRGARIEAAREYLVEDGQHVLDDQAIHQYGALLAECRTLRVGEGMNRPVLAPMDNRQGVVRVVLESTTDAVSIAGARRPAWRWRVIYLDGEARTAWTDDEGRLLRLLTPSQGLDATRDDIPR